MTALARSIIDANLYMTLATAEHGGTEWGPEHVQGSAHLRLYRAIASQHFVLDPDRKPDQRTPVAV